MILHQAGDIQLETLARIFDAKRVGNEYRARCVLHNDRTPSMDFDIKNGKLMVICRSGCDQKALFLEFMRRAGQEIVPACASSAPSRYSSAPDADVRNEAIWRTWETARPVRTGDPVDLYLRHRRIALPLFPPVLRFHPALKYWCPDRRECIGEMPAMVAQIQNTAGEVVSIHRTYLTVDGLKAAVPEPKKIMRAVRDGATKGAAILLFEPTDSVILAEGIETALSVHLDARLPVWAAVSAGGLEWLQLPASIRNVWIAVDDDSSGAGERAAESLSRRLQAEGRRCSLAYPPGERIGKGLDWNDVLGRAI